MLSGREPVDQVTLHLKWLILSWLLHEQKSEFSDALPMFHLSASSALMITEHSVEMSAKFFLMLSWYQRTLFSVHITLLPDQMTSLVARWATLLPLPLKICNSAHFIDRFHKGMAKNCSRCYGDNRSCRQTQGGHSWHFWTPPPSIPLMLCSCRTYVGFQECYST